jgi:hypothetical protein
VDGATLRAFTSKLRQFNLDFGILVAANGITGDAADRSHAHAHLRTEFNQTKLKVLVLDRAELEALTNTGDLALKLRQKYGAFIMGLAGF